MIPQHFFQEVAAHSKLEELAWAGDPVCPHCGAQDRIGSVKGRGARIALKFCCHCRKQFRATIRTIFEDSHVPLHKWFQACFLLYCCDDRINAHQLHTVLGVTYKTVSSMVCRLDDALAHSCDATSDRGGVHRKRSGLSQTHQAAVSPWVTSGTEAGETQPAMFAEKARDLGLTENYEKFDDVLRQILSAQPERERPYGDRQDSAAG